jgi:plasmid stability protein
MTYQLNTGIPDDLAAAVKSYADTRGISIAAAVRVLLWQAVKNEEATND